MAEEKKQSLGDILKKALEPKKAEAPKPIGTVAGGVKPTAKVGTGTGTVSGGVGVPDRGAVVKASEMRLKAEVEALEAARKKQEDVLHSKTHQDLINAAYKAGEKLGVSPWVILKDEWSNFTNTRGKKYTGPIIDDLKHLDDAQKKALKEVLGI